jgi:hypothetical protein
MNQIDEQIQIKNFIFKNEAEFFENHKKYKLKYGDDYLFLNEMLVLSSFLGKLNIFSYLTQETKNNIFDSTIRAVVEIDRNNIEFIKLLFENIHQLKNDNLIKFIATDSSIKDNYKVFKLILNYINPKEHVLISSCFSVATSNNSFNVLNIILENKEIINIVKNYHNTFIACFHIASLYEHKESFNLLLKHFSKDDFSSYLDKDNYHTEESIIDSAKELIINSVNSSYIDDLSENLIIKYKIYPRIKAFYEKKQINEKIGLIHDDISNNNTIAKIKI